MASVTSPITLTTGEISILKNLTIQGPGAALLTINGGGSGRIFYVAGAGVTGNINALTLTGGTGAGAVNTGRGGAAYNNLANMNLTNMVITGNTAANGGGINTAGAGSITTITNSTISNNTSTSSGGGLQNFSTSTTHVIGSTISGNTSTGSFGGAFQANGTTTFANSTISGNSASTSGGGLYFNGPSATIINSTITNNTTTGVGGGINKIGTNPLNIRNTLIAGNNGGATAPDVSGTIVSQGFNLVGRVDGSTGFTQPTDLTGTIAAPLNPLLGTLANNGGRTQTHALLTGSPAIDKGSAANYPVSTLPILTDQRDSIRPYDYPAIPDAAGGNGSDIGAYELKDVIGCTPPTMNPVPSDTVCHNAIHPAINFTSSTPGTTFSWTNNNASIGLGASGTGNIAAFTATNPGAAPVVATITVTPSIGGGSSIPTPELFYYDFDGTGTSVPNLASAPPAGTATATIVGGQTQGTAGMCGAGSLVGNGLTSTSNYVNTNWATNLGTSSWTISFKTSNIPPSATLFYIFGDPGAGSLRCFTNGVAGANNWMLRGPLTDVLVTGSATVAPHTITFVYDNTLNNIRAYRDGALVATVAQAALNINGAGPFKVGGYSSSTGLPAGGNLDEFRIYNRALTPAEVALVAGCPSAGPPCNGPSQIFTITVDPSPSVNPVSNQTVCAGAPTAPVNFTGTPPGATYSWTNNTTSIGLAASGTGNIASFIAQNNTALPVTATITVTPSTGGSTTPVTIPLPNQNGTFSGNVRGYWFTAPTNFTMTALRVPTDASSGNQSIAVVRFNPATPPPAFPGTTNAFTTLFLSQNNPAAGNIPVNITINAGDVIGILGQRATVNSYAPGPASTTIAGFPVTLTRMGMQFPLTTTAPQQLWQESAFQISRIFFDYTVGGAGGCTGTPRSFTITVSPNPDIVIVADPGTTICQGDPTLLTVVTGSATPVGTLYTQGTGTPSNGSPSQVFEPANAAFSSQAADDFTIPAGATWSVTQVTTSGINTAGGVPTSVNVFFYANSGSNLPGAAIASYTNLASFVRTGANYVVTLPAPLNLPGGTYWMSFQVNMSFATSGQWFWGNFGTTNIGNQYAWQNPGGGFATPCTSWGYGASGCGVGGTNRNNYFSIIGTSVTGGAPLPPGYTFLWSPAAGLSSTTSNPVAASPMTTTNYTVVVNNGAGCTRQASILITVNQRPTVTTQPASSTNCVGNTVTFTVGGTGTGLAYQWQVSPYRLWWTMDQLNQYGSL
ncbi:MAG: hypothetical protein IPL50_19440 [Chitinophagaceae bacterium]|nr:hypothetical protein [Chitinophagaceae bacterium]